MAPVASIQHPGCAATTERWLDRISTPAEQQRTMDFLGSLQADPQDQALEREISQRTTKGKSRAAAPTAGGAGWSYSATRGAVQQGLATLPTQAWDSEPPPQGSQATHTTQACLAAAAPSAWPLPSEYNQQQQQQWGAPPSQVMQQVASGALTSRSVAGSGAEQSPDVTTYHLAFHLAQMFPELYAQALAATQARPGPNSHGQSDWADSLKRGVDGAWRARFLRSVYDATNAEVYPNAAPPNQRNGAASQADAGPPRDGQQSQAEAGFFKWMARQQTYYRSLLKAGLLPAVDSKLLVKGQQHGALEALRQLHAVARPDLYLSHSQATHHHMRTCEDAELTALVCERTRIRTMGFPPPQIDGTYPTIAKLRSEAEATGQQQQQTSAGGGEPTKVDIVFGPANPDAGPATRPFTSGKMSGRRPGSSMGRGPTALTAERPVRPASAYAALAGQTDVPAPTHRGVKLTGPPVHAPKATFTSKLPIKWAAAAGVQTTSTYTDAFGSLAGGAGRRLASAGSSVPIKYREVTAPIGAVNPVTAMAGTRAAYPVPQCFTTTKPFPQGPGDDTMGTLYRTSYSSRDPDDVVRTLKAGATATANAKAASQRSELAMGKNGICMLNSKDWVSEHHGNYVGHTNDIGGDRERAAALKALMSGPTASAGKLTATHREARTARPPRPVSAAVAVA